MVKKLLVFLFFVVVFVFFIRPISSEGDFYHHMNLGRYVLEHKTLPKVDDFTFTARGKPVIYYTWASGIILYLIFTNFGDLGIAIFQATLACLTMYLLYWLLKTYRIPQIVIFATLFLIAGVISIRWPNRPELFTYPFILLLLLIDKLRSSKPILLDFYPPLFFLWSITYAASVPLGFILLFLFCAEQLIKDKLSLRPNAIRLYIISTLSILVSFFNGYGFKAIFYIFYIPKISTYVGEWSGIMEVLQKAPPSYLAVFNYRLLIYVIYLAVFLLVLILSLIQHHFRLRLILAGLLSLGLIIPFFSFRHSTLAAILAAPLLALLISSNKNKIKQALIALLIIMGAITWLISLKINQIQLKQATKPEPDKIVKFLKAKQIGGNAYTSQEYGSYLTFYMYPKIRVFLDTRDDLFLGTHVISDLNYYKNVMPLATKYGADLVVGDYSEGEDFYRLLLHSSHWSLVYADDNGFIALPKKEAQKLQLPQVKPLNDN